MEPGRFRRSRRRIVITFGNQGGRQKEEACLAGDVVVCHSPSPEGSAGCCFFNGSRPLESGYFLAPCASGCRAALSLGGPLREERSGLLLGSTRGSAQLSTMPEANYLFSVSWGYIKVCLRGEFDWRDCVCVRAIMSSSHYPH